MVWTSSRANSAGSAGLARQRVREHLVAAGADEDRRDDVGVRALVDAPELLLGADVRRCGP